MANRDLMLDVLKQFRVLLRSMDNHYRRVEKHSGLGGAQLWALAEVAAPGGITVGELSQKMGIHLSTASNLVRRLEEPGFITRARDAQDQRIVRLTVTPKGRRKLGQAPKPSAGLLQEALLKMTDRQLESLRGELARLLQRMGYDLRSRDAYAPFSEIMGDGGAKPRVALPRR